MTLKAPVLPIASVPQIYNTTSQSSRASVSDVAALYDLANPATDSDKLLVVAYWFQVVRGESELDSQSLNTELKHLGYPD